MNTAQKIQSVRYDIERGLKTRAINRLQGLINAYPNELEYRKEMGKLYASVDWKEKSGQYLLLSNPENIEEKNNIEVFLESINHSGYTALMVLKFKGDKTKLPESALKVLEDLEVKSLKEMKYIPTFAHRVPNGKIKGGTFRDTWKDKMVDTLMVVFLISIPVLVIIGIIQVIKWII